MTKPDQSSEWLLLSPPIAKMWAMEQAGEAPKRRLWLRSRPKPMHKLGTEDPQTESGTQG